MFFKVIARLVSGSNRVGFVVDKLDLAGNFQERLRLSDDQIKSLMYNGEIFDITFDNRGFRFKNKSLKLSDLPIVRVSGLSKPVRVRNSNIIVHEYTGIELKKYIKSIGVLKYKHRDFVKVLDEYFNSPCTRVLSISGLRGTGKTTGLLQSIHKLNDYNNTVFISIDSLADLDCLDLKNLLVRKYSDKKYIFIDEITRVKDLISNSEFLYNEFTSRGKKVVISGTDSLGLVKCEYAGLYHRVINKNVTHISYFEAKRTMNQSLREYMNAGGLYELDTIKSVSDIRGYIDTAVVDNIMNTLVKNNGVTGLLGLEKIKDRQKLRTLVFRIIYAVVYLNMTKTGVTSVTQMINLFKHTGLNEIRSLNSLVCAEMMVHDLVDMDINEVQSLLTAMEDLGLLVKSVNIYNKLEINYYITNPSIANHLRRSIFTILEQNKLARLPNASINSYNGLLFESIIVVHAKMMADRFGFNICYYRDDCNREVDLVVESEYISYRYPEDKNLYQLFEIKLTNDVDTAVVKTKWLKNKDVMDFFINRGEILRQNIIYTGKDVDSFNGFSSDTMYPPKGMTLEQIELQNKGVSLMSYDSFLSSLNNFMEELKTYEIDLD